MNKNRQLHDFTVELLSECGQHGPFLKIRCDIVATTKKEAEAMAREQLSCITGVDVYYDVGQGNPIFHEESRVTVEDNGSLTPPDENREKEDTR